MKTCNKKRKILTLVLLLLYLLLLLRNARVKAESVYLKENYPATVLEDGTLHTLQLLKKYKYPAEQHYVTTTDNYILSLQRMPRAEKSPILLMHGILDKSTAWLTMGPWSAIAYYLYDEGFDVWMGNVRGNKYSRNHTTLNPDVDKLFWSFSWHEMGYYDLPALIDYILKKTGYSKLGYVGHSQGTTIFWVLCSMRPEYNEKITVMNALAPVAFFEHIKFPIMKFGVNLLRLSRLFEEIEIFRYTPLFADSCTNSKISQNLCMETFYQLFGKDNELNMSMFPAFVRQFPAGCSIRQIIHFMQLYASKRFRAFDFGTENNQKMYGQSVPPDYPLSKITAPVALFYSANDMLSSVIDVRYLRKKLPNVMLDYLLPNKNWSHLMMVYGVSSRKFVQIKLQQLLRKYEQIN